MLGLSRAEHVRQRARALLTQEATVVTVTEATDASGNRVPVRTETTVPCRLEERETIPREAEEGGRIAARSVWTAYFPHGTSLQASDEVEIDGRSYAVVEDDSSRSSAAVLKVHLVRVGEG